MLNENVELLLGVLVFVSLSSDSDADFAGNVADTVHPHKSVERGIDTDILNQTRQVSSLSSGPSAS